MWIRVESYKKPVIDVGYEEAFVAPSDYNPVLLSLNGPDNQKIEVYLQDKTLAIRAASPDGALSSTFGTYCVPEQQWTCVGIIISSTSLIGFRSTLYINGTQVEKVNSKYQRYGNFTNNMLGGSYSDPKQTFFGQIGCFNVFGDTLSQSQMKAIFEVGPNYLGLFNEEEMKGSTTSGGSFEDDHILSYNARTQKGKFILNSCVVNSSSSAKIKNVETCIVTKIKDVIGCTEGIQVLFPLVLMLNKPSHPEFTSPYTDQQLLIYIIELINDLVTSSKEVGDDMIRNKGYTVLSHILKKIPSSCFSPELVRFLEKSYRCMNRNHELQKCFISDFVTDFSLWIYTPVDTQLELFTMLREMHSAGRKKVPVWLNLSILQMFYWARSENKEWCMCTAPRINPATKFVNGARPPEAKIEEIRRIQYETLRVQLENNDFDKDDIQSLLPFLCLEVSDIKGTIGVLRAINVFFSPTSQGFADKFYDEGGLGVLVRMLSTDSDDLLLTLINSIQTLVSVLSASPQFGDRVHGIAMAMYEALSQHIKMTLSVYKMLLGMCITDNPTPFAGSNWQDNYVLEYPEFLCHCVLRLSAVAEEPIRIAAIHDVCLLLERPANVERLILFPGWQSALVDIIMAQLASSAELRTDAPRGTPETTCPAGATEGGDQDGNDELGCARRSTFDVMCTILCTIGFTVITGPSEWRSFENLLSALQTAELKNGNLTNIMYYMKIRFYRALTESFRPRAGMSDGMGALYKRGTPQFQKACYAIVFIIDDIFAMHSNNPLSDSEDVCAILLNIVDYMSVSHITCVREWCGCDKPKPGASVVGASLALRNGGFAGLFIFACVNVVKLKCATSTRLGITGLHKAVDCMCKYCEETLPGFFGAFSDDFYYVVLFLMRTHDRLRETDESEYFTSVVNLVVGGFVKRRIKKFTDETTTFLNKALASVADATSHGGENEYLATAISADEGIKKKAHRFRNDVLRRNVAVGLKANTAFTESNRVCVARVAEAEAHLLQEATAATAALVEERKAQGTKRLQQLCRALREVNAEAAHKWRKIIRSLSSGKGPWGTAEAIVNWKLDETENSSRMRIKMKRNYSFDMHEGAAVATRNRQPSAPPAPTMKFATEVSAAKDAWMMLSTTGLSKKASKARKGTDTGAYYEDEDVVVDDEEIEKHEDEKKTLYETECNVIRPGKIYTGTLTIKKDGMLFVEGTESKSKVTKRAKKMFWRAEMIREVHFRRYMLVHTALEIFFDDSTNVFLNFGTVKIKEAVHRAIVKGVEPPNLAYSDSKTSQEILESSGLTEQWVNGEMSNFDYLMKLNTIAGRTYNDLRQYPVFPWIIADYTSKELDFNNPDTFRDLSKPVGALNPKRLETFRQRYENFCDPNVPPFMYATHYSSADTTFFYLLRVEPFTSYYVKHLRGRFDLADRMFGSIAKTWHNCLHGNSDIKELIPEFFYFPEFLRNANKFDFGETQAGVKLDDVVLPPWAHNSPEEFIRMNRAALESPYVSQHLHEWIDLIFGYKQRGKAAEEANNIFCFFTYEGAVDIDKIDNEIDRIAMRDQIANFGQTPAQLLTKPHPQRKVLPAATAPVTPSFLHNDFFAHLNESYKMGSIVACNSPASSSSSSSKKIVFVATPESVITDLAFSFISNNPNRLITVDCLYNIYTTVNPDNLFLLSEFDAGSDGETGTNSDDDNNNNDDNGTKDPHSLTRDNFAIEKVQRVHGIKDDVCNDNFFSLTENGAFMLCCGFWDNSFRILGLEDDSIGDTAVPSVMQKVCKHKDLVTCIRFDEYTGVVATGSRDTSIMLWNVTDNNPMRVHERPFNVLYGHNDEIVSLDINAELDIVASCARDGCLMVHTIRSGGFVWSAQVSEPGCPSMLVKISPNGNIVVCVPQRSEIFVYNVNGRLLSSQKYECEAKTSSEGEKDEGSGARDTINAMMVILGGDALVTCGDKRLCFWRLCDMKICFSIELEAPAYCIHVSNNETFYYVGLKNGKVLVLKA